MSKISSLEEARKNKELKRVIDAIIEDLQCDPLTLSELMGVEREDLEDSIHDALERKEIYRQLNVISAEEDINKGIKADQCYNAVCPRFARSNNKNYCSKGIDEAQSCMYRMKDKPPSDPWQSIPSHTEAVRMLQRANLLIPDEFGEYNGTDFMQKNNVRKLWVAYINLLADTKKINRAVFKSSSGEESDYATMGKSAIKILIKENNNE